MKEREEISKIMVKEKDRVGYHFKCCKLSVLWLR